MSPPVVPNRRFSITTVASRLASEHDGGLTSSSAWRPLFDGILAHNRGNSYWGGALLSVFVPLGWLIAPLMRKDYRALAARKEQ